VFCIKKIKKLMVNGFAPLPIPIPIAIGIGIGRGAGGEVGISKK
jgi:hypothetical protein